MTVDLVIYIWHVLTDISSFLLFFFSSFLLFFFSSFLFFFFSGALGVNVNQVLPSKHTAALEHVSSSSTGRSSNTGRSRRGSFGRLSRQQRLRWNKGPSSTSSTSSKEKEPTWIEVQPTDGTPRYYYHRITRETSWTIPEVMEEPLPPPPPPPSLPAARLPSSSPGVKNLNFFLASIGMTEYLPNFYAEELTLEQLQAVSANGRSVLDSVLKEVGVNKIGQRMKIYLALQ